MQQNSNSQFELLNQPKRFFFLINLIKHQDSIANYHKNSETRQPNRSNKEKINKPHLSLIDRKLIGN
jgi:hypothetical protein